MATIPKRCSDSFHERKTKDHASGSPLLMVCTLVLFLESCLSTVTLTQLIRATCTYQIGPFQC